jgi:hypothetical protein
MSNMPIDRRNALLIENVSHFVMLKLSECEHSTIRQLVLKEGDITELIISG